MKINFIYLRLYLRLCQVALFVMAGTLAFRAQADCHVSLEEGINASLPTTANGWGINASSNSVSAFNENLQSQFMVSSNGVWAYCELDRKVINKMVYDTSHVSGTAVSEEYAPGDSEGSGAYAFSSVQISEDMLIQYVPDSITDTPPTSISFQMNYLVQAHMTANYWPDGAWDPAYVAGANINVAGINLALPNPVQLYAPAVTYSISTYALSQVMTVPIDQTTTVGDNQLSAAVRWDSPAEILTNANYLYYGNMSYSTENYAPPCSYNVSFYFAGYTNIVDQNNQPVPSNKLIFWCVATNNATNLVAMPIQPDLSTEEAVALQAIPGTNSLTLQWPLYASNYQLQMASDLLSGTWTTNSLPPPVQAGPYLQVTVPATNSCAFFRLLQTN
jgi:hypothetical protein